MTSKMRLIVFPGVQNLPNFAAEANGFFAKRDLSVETTFTTSSEQQREGLAKGLYDIAHAAIDNAVAMVDVAGEDIAIVIGLDQAFNKLVVRPEIASYEDLRGKILGVDAPDTAFALVVYDMLARKGLKPGDYEVLPIGATRFRLEALQAGEIDFAMLNLPFNLMAQRAGLAVLEDPAKVIGAYQSTGGFVQRAWARANRAMLCSYLAAYIEGLRWVLDPANRAQAIALLAQRMELTPEMAADCFAQMSDPALGFSVDAAIDHAGMKKVLALRAAFKGNENPASAELYVDESFYREALATL